MSRTLRLASSLRLLFGLLAELSQAALESEALSGDDKARIHAARLEGLLIEDDGPEEVTVRNLGCRIGDVALGSIGDVLPQDSPVLARVPNIGPLVDGDNKLDPPVEKVINGLSSGLLHSAEL
jgi:hypothetical protein